MPLVIADNTGTTGGAVVFHGQNIQTFLAAQLAIFAILANTAAGNALLTPILAGPGAYEVIVKHGGATATNGKRVTINIDDTSFAHGQPKPDGDKEFVESTIFELVNATNDANFLALDTQLNNRQTTLWQYADAKSDLEAQASWTVGTILNQAAGPPLNYVPSTWGARQIANTVNAHPNLGAFQGPFRLAAHDASAATTDPKSLPTREFYAFNAAWKIAAKQFSNGMSIVGSVTRGTGGMRKKVNFFNLISKALGTEANQVNKDNVKAVGCYYLIMDILTNPAPLGIPNFAVAWTGGVAAGWTFTPAMIAAANPAPPTTWSNNLKAAFKTTTEKPGTAHIWD